MGLSFILDEALGEGGNPESLGLAQRDVLMLSSPKRRIQWWD